MIALGEVLARYEDEMVCDLAQYYHLHGYEAFDAYHVAVLVSGLPEESRVVRKMAKNRLTLKEALLAVACDRLSLLVWMKTKDGQKNRRRPKSLFEELTKEKKGEEYAVMSVEEVKERLGIV